MSLILLHFYKQYNLTMGLPMIIVQLLDIEKEDVDEDGANADLDAQREGKSCVIKTSTRQVLIQSLWESLSFFSKQQPLFFFFQTIFLPVAGLVDAKTLKPGDLVGVNKDSYLILDTLPAEYVDDIYLISFN